MSWFSDDFGGPLGHFGARPKNMYLFIQQGLPCRLQVVPWFVQIGSRPCQRSGLPQRIQGMHHADCGSPFADRHGLRLDRSLRRRASDRNRRDCPSHPRLGKMSRTSQRWKQIWTPKTSMWKTFSLWKWCFRVPVPGAFFWTRHSSFPIWKRISVDLRTTKYSLMYPRINKCCLFFFGVYWFSPKKGSKRDFICLRNGFAQKQRTPKYPVVQNVVMFWWWC